MGKPIYRLYLQLSSGILAMPENLYHKNIEKLCERLSSVFSCCSSVPLPPSKRTLRCPTSSPNPLEMTSGQGQFTISRNARVCNRQRGGKIGQVLHRLLQPPFRIPFGPGQERCGRGSDRLFRPEKRGETSGGYTLTVTRSDPYREMTVRVCSMACRASSRCCLPGRECCPSSGGDDSRLSPFRIPGHALRLRPAFLPMEYVKRYIDYLALHKMNYFHWHI